MGNYPKALEFYEKSLKIRVKLLGEKHLNTATSYNNMGSVYQNMNKYTEALEYY